MRVYLLNHKFKLESLLSNSKTFSLNSVIYETALHSPIIAVPPISNFSLIIKHSYIIINTLIINNLPLIILVFINYVISILRLVFSLLNINKLAPYIINIKHICQVSRKYWVHYFCTFCLIFYWHIFLYVFRKVIWAQLFDKLNE